MRLPYLFFLLCFSVPFLVEAQAPSLPEQQAALFDTQARASFEVGDYSEALALWKKAYLSTSDPILLLSLGLCYEKLGQLTEAKQQYELFLQKADPKKVSPEDRETILYKVQVLSGVLTTLAETPTVKPIPLSVTLTTPEPKPKTFLWLGAGATLIGGTILSVFLLTREPLPPSIGEISVFELWGTQ